MTAIEADTMQLTIGRLRHELNTVLAGKEDVVEQVLACLLARGHLLIEDLPGLGKTTLAKAVARAVHGRFARVQCTPDLLPSDVTGFHLFNQKTREFEFRPGAVFADILLADEINRATPRTQSALFEAMAERTVTIDGHTHALPGSFFVIATQNPVESHGAYPLPEAQLDRFAMKLSIGYPDRENEARMLADAVQSRGADRSQIEPVVDLDRLAEIQNHVAQLEVGAKVRDYLIDLAAATRSHSQIALGLSPRGLLIWQSLAQAEAFLQGREFVIPDDVQRMAKPVLMVRLMTESARLEHVVDEVVRKVPVPV